MEVSIFEKEKVKLHWMFPGDNNPIKCNKLWKPKLIGLHGPARCGKDTAAGMLEKAFEVRKVAFADPIRDALRAMLGLTNEHFFGNLKEIEIPWLGVSPRRLMQTMGTEWGRGMVHPDLWLMIAGQKIDAYHSAARHVVVTDVRFENEADYIRKKGGVVWHVKRNGIETVASHVSEAGVAFKPGDVKIDNNGTLDDLLDEVCDKF